MDKLPDRDRFCRQPQHEGSHQVRTRQANQGTTGHSNSNSYAVTVTNDLTCQRVNDAA